MRNLQEGDVVRYSGVGSGTITSFTDRGYPKVNDVAVAALELEDGTIFNPHEHDMAELRKRSETCDAARPPVTEAVVELTISSPDEPKVCHDDVARRVNMGLQLLEALEKRCEDVGIPFDESDMDDMLGTYVQHRIDWG